MNVEQDDLVGAELLEDHPAANEHGCWKYEGYFEYDMHPNVLAGPQTNHSLVATSLACLRFLNTSLIAMYFSLRSPSNLSHFSDL
jgi:hypothetical protein